MDQYFARISDLYDKWATTDVDVGKLHINLVLADLAGSVVDDVCIRFGFRQLQLDWNGFARRRHTGYIQVPLACAMKANQEFFFFVKAYLVQAFAMSNGLAWIGNSRREWTTSDLFTVEV